MTTQRELENRFEHHIPSEEKKIKYQNLRREFLNLAEIINLTVPESREKEIALTKLEEALFFSNAGIARH